MYRIRTVTTKSKATAIQVVEYKKRSTIILKHIGSSVLQNEIELMKIVALKWIEKQDPQQSLFTQTKRNKKSKDSKILVVNQLELLSTHSLFTYEVLTRIYNYLGFVKLNIDEGRNKLLMDMVIARIIFPSSKLESLRLLEEKFGIIYEKSYMYRQLLTWVNLKNNVEGIAVNFAKKKLSFDFGVVFYDVTTLYFESFKTDEELKKCGFSKDNKFNQPQVVIGLIVNDQGFPIGYQVFAGNKFEGHTFIPMIEDLQKKHNIKQFTVVADAAMISQENVGKLNKKNINYIVGARLGNLSQNIIQEIYEALGKRENTTCRLETDRGNLICAFSKKRYSKDKFETNKQIARAENAIKNPAKRIKKIKFVTTATSKPNLNKKLVEKTKLLWGIKGYYSDLDNFTNQQIIDYYRQLWKVEKSFRIAKSDLQMRPIYHHKTKGIKAHLLTCFMALSVAKYLEIKSGFSIKKILRILNTVKDARIKNNLINEIVVMRSQPTPAVDNLTMKLGLSH